MWVTKFPSPAASDLGAAELAAHDRLDLREERRHFILPLSSVLPRSRKGDKRKERRERERREGREEKGREEKERK